MLILGVVKSPLMAWLPGALVRDSLYGPTLDKLFVVPNMPLKELYLGQSEGDGVLVSSLHNGSFGLELVPFEEGEPLSLNWSQSLVDDDCRGC